MQLFTGCAKGKVKKKKKKNPCFICKSQLSSNCYTRIILLWQCLIGRCVHVCSVMPDSLATPWTVAHQAALPMGFSRQEYWSGLPFTYSRGSSQPKDWTRNRMMGHYLFFSLDLWQCTWASWWRCEIWTTDSKLTFSVRTVRECKLMNIYIYISVLFHFKTNIF